MIEILDTFEMLQHPTSMLHLTLGEHARKRHNRHPQPLGTIEPRLVTLETENPPPRPAKVAVKMRLASHLDPPTTT
jgi:hypothetical protein